MKIKEIKELRAKDIKDLEALVIKKRQELLKLNVKLLAGKEKNVKLLKNMKKDIVQLLTLKSETAATRKSLTPVLCVGVSALWIM